MIKKYGVRDDWDGLFEVFDTLKQADQLYEYTKTEKMSEGVDINESFVSIVESDDEFENERVIKKSIAVVDHELTKEIGTPEQNGYEYDYWAKWEEVVS